MHSRQVVKERNDERGISWYFVNCFVGVSRVHALSGLLCAHANVFAAATTLESSLSSPDNAGHLAQIVNAIPQNAQFGDLSGTSGAMIMIMHTKTQFKMGMHSSLK